jgi:8-oxo-dGTP pyrophosphatase MutT (NUDIX family)
MSIESEKKLEKYWVSLAGVIIQNDKCLILELSMFPGQWDIPGGRIEIDENYTEAFLRELEEEVGFVNVKVIEVVDYDLWYAGNRKMPVCAIAHLVKTNESEVKLSHEHLSYKWVSQEELKEYKFLWPKAKRMIEKGFKKHNELKRV